MMKKIVLFLLVFCLCMPFLVACAPPPDQDGVFVDNPEEHYDLKFYMPYIGSGTAPMNDLDAVVEEVNKITEREINASVEIIAYNYYEYSQKMTNVIASSEVFDICHTSPSINHYFLNVQRKAFYPIDYLLDTYAPVTKSQVSEDIWKQVEVGGKKYATINLQILPRTFSYFLNNTENMEDFIKAKYPDYTYETIWQAPIHKLQFIEEYLGWLRQTGKGVGGYTSRIDTVATLQNLYGFDDLSTGMGCPGAVRASDDLKDGKLTVVNQFESEEYQEMLEYATRWRQMGYIDSQKIQNAQDHENMDLVFNGTWKPGEEQVMSDGTVHNSIQLGEPTYFSSFILGTMNAISSRSKNPARAMKFIELMSTNKELHNLLQFGLEGEHYTKVEGEENRIELIPNSGYDNRWFGWGLGNEFNSYVYDQQPSDIHEQSQTINETARKPAVIGFNFDPEPVKQKIADCLAVSGEYMQTLSEGGYKDQEKAYQDFLAALKAAGCDDVIAEKQRQLDAWVATQLSK